MGESACLMQPFSYAAGIPNEDQVQEGNPIHALGQSISFGRFMSESLAWEKWSTFSSHNRYVEEAERYSRPGSVAQKKAFFEEHYKKVAAARKAAALLEQANGTSNIALDQSESEGRDHDMVTQDPQMLSVTSQECEVRDHDMVAQDSQMLSITSQEPVNEQEEVTDLNNEESSVVESNGLSSNSKIKVLENDKLKEADQVTEQKVLVENSMRVDLLNKLGASNGNEVRDMELSGPVQKENYVKIESPKKLGLVDKEKEVKESKLGRMEQMEKPLAMHDSKTAQDCSLSTSKKRPTFSSSKSSSYGRGSKVSSSPVKPTAPVHFKNENDATPIAKKSTIDSAPVHLKKENNATPITKKSAMDTVDKRRMTPKSSQRSYNFTPAKEVNRLTSKIIRKIDGSRIGFNSKMPKEVSTPLRTPNTASVQRVAKSSMITPLSENRSARMAPDSSASRSKTVRSRWNFLPTENKPQSPSTFTPFGLRVEERAARRKEKLEEKFKATEVKKQLQQATLKEKAEIEIKKLRQTLCFKARPLPDFYKERRTPKNQTEKVPSTHPESKSTALRRKTGPSSTSIVQTKTSHPQRSSTKNSSSNHVQANNNQASARSHSLPETTTSENMSRNIQQG
ncbi:protein WVD2-like 4 isoform X2 [Carica papaya]|uniref:protein WVD2-like 4 isoform X2 n=1 Tax=Carica papaya TaxID=3649 RepID=UPI000B8C9A01|nr:protein WVD2-like 4 isoform X2 [Carica papaya]